MRHGSQRGLREKSSVRHQAKLLLLALPPLLLLHWKEKKEWNPFFLLLLLTIVFLLLQHGGLINEKIVQYEIEVQRVVSKKMPLNHVAITLGGHGLCKKGQIHLPLMDRLSKNFFLYVFRF